MITLIFSLCITGGIFAAAFFAGDWGWGWSIFTGIAAFAVSQGVSGFILQRRIKAGMQRVQHIIENGQKNLQQKMQRWQIRPPSSIKEAQRLMMEDTKLFVNDALREADTLKRFRLWMPMMDRQIATMKMQLYWSIKDFKSVDALMPKVLLLDPSIAAVKMARMYMLNEPTAAIRKIYDKAVRRVRYNGNVLPAATMSWIEVRRNETEAAFKTLTEALKNSDNETLKRNHEQLMNNRIAHFNNSGLGDLWYTLLLEEPKVHAQRQRSFYR